MMTNYRLFMDIGILLAIFIPSYLIASAIMRQIVKALKCWL